MDAGCSGVGEWEMTPSSTPMTLGLSQSPFGFTRRWDLCNRPEIDYGVRLLGLAIGMVMGTVGVEMLHALSFWD